MNPDALADQALEQSLRKKVREFVGPFFNRGSFRPGEKLIARKFGLPVETVKRLVSEMYPKEKP